MVSHERLQVFISSVMTEENLSAERDAVRESILALQLTVPWAFEYAPAEPSKSDIVYLREVELSDLMVCVVSNSHTPAVQTELDTAAAHGRPILAFVRILPADQSSTSGRLKVLQWLRDRVKYRYFSTVDDLKAATRDSIAAELVRGYRQYRVDHADFRILFNAVSSPPSLVVRPAEPADQPSIERALLELVDWYPEVRTWVSKIGSELAIPQTHMRIAKLAGEVAGIAVSREKGSSVRKFSTLYVRPGFRGEAVGPRLVHDEVMRAAADGIRKAYVTFAGELFESLHPILGRYGFVPEGVSAGRYRPRSAEWIMSKTFIYNPINSDSFEGFVLDRFVHDQGGRILTSSGGAHLVELPKAALLGAPVAPQFYLIISSSEAPEDDYAARWIASGAEPWLFVSLYGRPANVEHWSHRVGNWLDGEDLASRFYPVKLERPSESSLLVTIRLSYADALIPDSRRPPLFEQERLQIRPDNSYYRTPDRYATLRRGARIFFYVSEPEKSLRGSARIRDLRVDQPEALVAAYGSMGILSFEDITKIAARHNGRALAIGFDWYQEHHTRVTFEALRDQLSYNPTGARLLSYDESQSLVLEAGIA